MNERVRVIGGGLAGCEAALQLASRGFKVDLYEMRPVRQTPAHKDGHHYPETDLEYPCVVVYFHLPSSLSVSSPARNTCAAVSSR